MIKKTLIAASLALAAPLAHADAGFFIGLVYQFGGSNAGLGISAKVLSSDEEDEAVVGAGVSFYPMAAPGAQFGADLGVGYNFEDAGIMVGYDFLRGGVQVGVGHVNTEDEDNAVIVTPPPPPFES